METQTSPSADIPDGPFNTSGVVETTASNASSNSSHWDNSSSRNASGDIWNASTANSTGGGNGSSNSSSDNGEAGYDNATGLATNLSSESNESNASSATAVGNWSTQSSTALVSTLANVSSSNVSSGDTSAGNMSGGNASGSNVSRAASANASGAANTSDHTGANASGGGGLPYLAGGVHSMSLNASISNATHLNQSVTPPTDTGLSDLLSDVICVAPALRLLQSMGATFTAQFESISQRGESQAELLGGAQIVSGRLELTANPSAGAGVWQLTQAAGRTPFELFEIDTLLLLGGHESGVCLSYGPAHVFPPSGRAGCGEEGLGLLFHISPAHCSAGRAAGGSGVEQAACQRSGMRVQLNGALLLEHGLGQALEDPSWAPASVSLTEEGEGLRLAVTYAEESFSELFTAERWHPASSWTVALAAWDGRDPAAGPLAADAVGWVGGFELRTGALLRHARGGLSIVLNPDSELNKDGVFVSDAWPFDFYRPPSVHTLTPDRTPAGIAAAVSVEAHGTDVLGAMSGNGSGVDLRCRFGTAVVPASYVPPGGGAEPTPYPRFSCATPTETLVSDRPLSLPVQVSFNGQQFGPQSGSFVFLPPPQVQDLHPARGPVAGGTLVWVRGSGLAHGLNSRYRCRFGTQVVRATYDSTTRAVLCVSPPLRFDNATTGVRPNETTTRELCQLFPINETDSIEALILAEAAEEAAAALASIMAIDTNHSTAHSRTLLTKTTRLLNATHSQLCTASNETTLPAPLNRSESTHVEVSLNDQDYSTSPLPRSFQYIAALEIQSLRPASGPTLGGQHISITGSEFDPSVQYSCRFGVALVLAELINSSLLRCPVPTAQAAGASDAVELNFSDPWLFARGAPMARRDELLVLPPETVVYDLYSPPEEPVVTSLRIATEPAPLTTAGTPFDGLLTVETIDQFGEPIAANGKEVLIFLMFDANATLPPESQLQLAGDGSATLSALSALGVAVFSGLMLNEIGDGFYFSVAMAGAQPVRTQSSFKVVIGSAAGLR